MNTGATIFVTAILKHKAPKNTQKDNYKANKIIATLKTGLNLK